jgi:hypothetical protein
VTASGIVNEHTETTRERLRYLEHGEVYRFLDWPNETVRGIQAAVYTIWHEAKFMYVGRSTEGSEKGLFGRLGKHASGKRGGDQFNIYVCDWLILPRLTREQIERVGRRELSLDSLCKEHVQGNFSYRFVAVESDAAAIELEDAIRRGALSVGKPFLNPK